MGKSKDSRSFWSKGVQRRLPAKVALQPKIEAQISPNRHSAEPPFLPPTSLDRTMASSSSMSHQTASYMSPDDSTYQSLLSLLSSPSASSSTHLSLLPSNSLYGSITLYLSCLDTDSLPHFIQTLATSKVFWDVTDIVKPAPNRIHEDVLQPSPTPTERRS